MKRALLLCLVVFLGFLNIANAADAKAYTDAVKALADAETAAKKAYDDAVAKAVAEKDDKDAAKNADLAAADAKVKAAEKALADNKDDTKKDDLTKKVATEKAALKVEALKIADLKKLDDAVTAATTAKSAGPTCTEKVTAFTDKDCKKAPTKDAKTAMLPAGVEDALKLTKGKECVDLAEGAKDVLSVKVKTSLMQKDASCTVTVEKYSDKACATVLTKDATVELKSGKTCVANPFVQGGFAKVGEVEAKKDTTPEAGNKTNTTGDAKKEEGSGAGMYILVAVIVVVVCAAGFFAYKKFGAGAKTD